MVTYIEKFSLTNRNLGIGNSTFGEDSLNRNIRKWRRDYTGEYPYGIKKQSRLQHPTGMAYVKVRVV